MNSNKWLGLRITGLFTLRPLRGLGFRKTAVGLRPLCGFAEAHLGQGSLLRIALLPAPNDVNIRNVMRNVHQHYCKY